MFIYIIIGIIAIISIAFFTNFSKRSETENNKENPIEKSETGNQFKEMREMVFSANSEQIGLNSIDDKKVFGLITEIDVDGETACVVSFLTGDTSLYLSSGGGYIGAGQHEEVREMVAKKVDGFQKYLSLAIKIDKSELPESETVNFNFLTNNGIYIATENMTELESGNSELSILYMEVNEIIEQIRLKSNE